MEAIKKQRESNIELLEFRKSEVVYNQLKQEIIDFLVNNKELIKSKLTNGEYITNLQVYTDIQYVTYSLIPIEDIQKMSEEIYNETNINLFICNDTKVVLLDIVI